MRGSRKWSRHWNIVAECHANFFLVFAPGFDPKVLSTDIVQDCTRVGSNKSEGIIPATYLATRLRSGIWAMFQPEQRLCSGNQTPSSSLVGPLGHVVVILEDFQYLDLAAQAREKMEGLLKEKCSQLDAPASAFISLGNIYWKKQDHKAAIERYR